MSNTPTRPVKRRRFLSTLGAAGLAGSAGCLDRFPFLGDIDPPEFGSVEAGWPMVGKDPANTARNTAATGPVSEPEIIWEAKPGSKIPTAAIDDDIFAINTEEELLVFDLGDNELVFERDVDAQFSTPVVDQQRLFAKTDEETLARFDPDTGEKIWSFETTGTVETPIVSEGVVVVQDTLGNIYAIDAETGNHLWQVEEEHKLRVSYSYAIVDSIVYFAGARYLVAVTLHDGEELWRVEGFSGSPAIYDEGIFIRTPKTTLLTKDGELRWEATIRASTPTLVKDRACGVTGAPNQVVLSAQTGEILWRQRNKHWGGRPISDGTFAYIGSTDHAGRLYCIDPINETEVYQKRFDEVISVLGLADDMLFIGTPRGKIMALK